MEDTIAESEATEKNIQQQVVVAALVIGLALLVGAIALLFQRRSMQ